VFRYLALTTHYRSPLNFSWTSLEQAKNAYAGLVQKLLYIDFFSRNLKRQPTEEPDGVLAARTAFTGALNNDLNTPQALAALYNLAGNKSLITRAPKHVLRAILDFDTVFGLKLKETVQAHSAKRLLRDQKLKKLLTERDKYRRYQHFVQADRLRKKINVLGYVVEDTPAGTFVAPKTTI
jgi:cysteinyl-tRNA synthetase